VARIKNGACRSGEKSNPIKRNLSAAYAQLRFNTLEVKDG
jgi:hypothetical protein